MHKLSHITSFHIAAQKQQHLHFFFADAVNKNLRLLVHVGFGLIHLEEVNATNNE